MDITAFIASLVAQFTGVQAALIAGLASIAGFLPADEKAILYKALKAAQTDIAAGKTPGQAVADAWSTFYNAEITEANKVGMFLLGAILTSLAPAA